MIVIRIPGKMIIDSGLIVIRGSRFSERWLRWSRNILHRGEEALDITEGKLFSTGNW